MPPTTLKNGPTFNQWCKFKLLWELGWPKPCLIFSLLAKEKVSMFCHHWKICSCSLHVFISYFLPNSGCKNILCSITLLWIKIFLKLTGIFSPLMDTLERYAPVKVVGVGYFRQTESAAARMESRDLCNCLWGGA